MDALLPTAIQFQWFLAFQEGRLRCLTPILKTITNLSYLQKGQSYIFLVPDLICNMSGFAAL